MQIQPPEIATHRTARRRGLRRARKILVWLLALGNLAGLVLLPLVFGGHLREPWADHLASAHNQALLALLLLSLALGLLVRRRLRRPLAPLLVLAFWAGQMLALPAAPRLTKQDGAPMRLLSLNAQGDAQNAGRILTLIKTVRPDIICLQEASGDKTALQELLRDQYPHQLQSRPGFGWFTMLLSRFPLDPVDEAPRRVMATFEQGSLQSAIVHTPDGPVLIGTCHLIRGNEHIAIWKAGNRAALQVSEHLSQAALDAGVPALLAGDLNGGPFSQRGRGFRAGGPWRLARRPTPWRGTWPSHLPFFLRVQPDQIYVTPGLGIRRYRLEGSVGSDHRPIIVEFGRLR